MTRPPSGSRDWTISGNRATGDGGGAYLYELYGAVEIENTTIADNTAGDDGGESFFLTRLYDDGHFTMRNSTVEGNRAEDGGGLFLYYIEGNARIVNSTVSGNTASDEGGGVYLYDSPSTLSVVRFRDTTIADNAANNVNPADEDAGTDTAGAVGAGRRDLPLRLER